MGLFKLNQKNSKRQKSQQESTVRIFDDVDLDKKYEESMAFFASQEALDKQQYQEIEKAHAELAGRIAQLDNAPGTKRATAAAKRMGEKLIAELEEKHTTNFLTWEQKYHQVIMLIEQLNNGNTTNQKWDMVPLDAKRFTFYAYLLEKQLNHPLSDFESHLLSEISLSISKYPDICRNIVLSLSILVYLDLINIDDIKDYNNPRLFEKIINVLKNQDIEFVLNNDQMSNSLGKTISGVVNGLTLSQGKMGFVDDYYSGKFYYGNNTPNLNEPVGRRS